MFGFYRTFGYSAICEQHTALKVCSTSVCLTGTVTMLEHIQQPDAFTAKAPAGLTHQSSVVDHLFLKKPQAKERCPLWRYSFHYRYVLVWHGFKYPICAPKNYSWIWDDWWLFHLGGRGGKITMFDEIQVNTLKKCNKAWAMFAAARHVKMTRACSWQVIRADGSNWTFDLGAKVCHKESSFSPSASDKASSLRPVWQRRGKPHVHVHYRVSYPI